MTLFAVRCFFFFFKYSTAIFMINASHVSGMHICESYTATSGSISSLFEATPTMEPLVGVASTMDTPGAAMPPFETSSGACTE